MNNEVKVGIRAAAATDANAILALMKKLQTESDFFELDVNFDKITARQEAQQIELMNASGTNIILVASVSKYLIGIATVQRLDDQTGELGVAVLNKYQGMGLGTMLVDELINWQVNYSNLQSLVLEVKKNNLPALHIYQKLGFNAYLKKVDTIWMKK